MAVKKNVTRSIDKFIDNGAEVKARKEKGFKNVLVRMPMIILEELDQRVEKRPWLTRTQWILEAIHKKLRDCANGGGE